MTLLMRIMRQSLLNLKPLSILLVEGQDQIASLVRIMQFNSRQHLGDLSIRPRGFMTAPYKKVFHLLSTRIPVPQGP